MQYSIMYDPWGSLQASKYVRKVTLEWVDRYPSIRRLALSIVGRRRRGSPGTVQRYVTAVRFLCVFCGFESPEELLGSGLDFARVIDEQGVGWIDSLLNEGYAGSTVNGHVMGVKKWLGVNGVEVDWGLVEMPSTEPKIMDRAPTREEMQLMVEHSPQLKDRVALYCLSSSGLRINTFLSLCWGDLEFHDDLVLVKVRKAAGRKFGSRRGTRGTVQLYVTFFSVEARDALLKYRQQLGREDVEVDDDTPLLLNDNDGGRLSVNGFQYRYYRVLDRAGLTMKSHHVYVLHIHTLRKWFRSRCVGVDESYREHWMGHKGGYLDESYFRAEEQRHIEEYRRIMPNLTVYPTAELEARMQELEEKQAEVRGLRSEIQEVREWIRERERFEKLK